MELIQGLTVAQEVAIGAATMLVLLLVLVTVRRRREAVVKAADESTPKERRRRGRRGAAQKGDAPRRKRRKLASEATRAMGDEPDLTVSAGLPRDYEIAQATAIEVPPVPTAAAAAVADSVTLAPAEDPYLATPDDRPADPVAQPGWPSPGELASGFDPDAFDPLPEPDADVHSAHDGAPDTAVLFIDEDDEDEPAVDVPDPAPTHDEIHEVWAESADDEFDPATGWAGESENPGMASAPAIDLWTGDDVPESLQDGDTQEVSVVEGGWDVDTEESWNTQLELPTLKDTPIVESEAVADPPGPQEWAEEPVVWDAEPVDVAPLTVPFPAPGTLPAHEVTVADLAQRHGQTGPVVLDLAGLAASGQSLELVIEPNGDGNGVRLRFGTPAVAESLTSAADEHVRVQEPADIEPDECPQDEVADSADGFAGYAADEILVDDVTVDAPPSEPAGLEDVVFLTGGLPSSDVSPWEPVDEPDAEDASSEAMVIAPTDAPIEPIEIVVESDGFEPDDRAHADYVAAGNGHETDADDPARILADIRARLAALDARRFGSGE